MDRVGGHEPWYEDGQVALHLGDALEVAALRAGEIQTKIADLNVQIVNAGVQDQVNLDDLTAAAQALDDIVPDTPEIAEELPAEVPGEGPPF